MPLDVLPPNCAGKYMPSLSLELVQKGATAPTTDYGYNATFECPTSGRIGDFAEGIARSLSERVNTGTWVEKIDMQARRCVTKYGEYLYDFIVSTAPLPQTVAMTGLAVKEPAQFRSARVSVVRVGFVGRILRPEQWYYTPDRSVPFYRIVLPTNIHAGLAPQGRSILSIEVSAEAGPLVAESVARDALEYLADVGAVIWSEIEVVDAQMIDPAYVFNRAETSPSIIATRRELERHGVFSAGRYGEWEYFSIDQAARSGFEVATKLIRGGGSK